MVQRKARCKLGSPTEPKQTHVKPERHLPSLQQQDTRSKGGGGGGGGGDLKKTMKKIRSIKASINTSDGSPNYMKPTSSWDARKEQYQVTPQSPGTTNKNQSPRNQKKLNHSKTSTSPAGSGLKPVKIQSRKPSLKRAKASMKKSSGVALYPPKVVNRATCSSTLKDSRFPKALELNPGGTEAEGTSIMKVCPYNYCSLNGHVHEPLPPLKSFMSAARKLLKTQKSFKVKGQPSFRMKGLGKDEKEIDTAQTAISRTASGLAIIPLIEEITNDFFVEIYAKPQQQIVEPKNCDEVNTLNEDDIEKPQVLEGGEGTKCEVEEGNGRDALNQRDESYSDIGLEDDLDQKSDLSVEEMDVMMNFMEYVECDQQIEAGAGDQHSSVPEDYAEWCFERYIFDVLGKEIEAFAESEEIAEGNNCDGSSESNDTGSHGDKQNSETDVPFCCSSKTSDRSGCLVQNQPTLETDSSEENERDEELITEVTEPLSNKQKISDSSCLGCQDEVSEEEQEGSENGYAFPDKDNNGINITKGEVFETNDLETNQQEILDNTIPSSCIKEKEDKDGEVEDTSSLSIIQLAESCQGSTEPDVATDGDHLQIKLDGEECNSDEASEDASSIPEIDNPSIEQSEEDSTERNKEKLERKQEEVDEIEETMSQATKHDCIEVNEATQIMDDIDSDIDDICLLSNNRSLEEYKIINNATVKSNHPPTDPGDKQKTRIRITRKITTEESEQMKDFNPRSPNFLPVEPDPEAEKVDLRHQMTDEKKNTDEWMIDYALQQAVSKLAPARKKKVALLVEAFETVMPLPICDEPLRPAASGIANARPIQACS